MLLLLFLWETLEEFVFLGLLEQRPRELEFELTFSWDCECWKEF